MDEQALKTQTAIRCAKVADLLASLSNRNISATTIDTEPDEEKEIMEREIRDLKLELVKERIKCKRIQLSGWMELVFEFMLMVFVSIVLLYFAFSY